LEDGTYRQHGWRGVLVAVLPLALGCCWFLLVGRIRGFAVVVPGTRVPAVSGGCGVILNR
jgi:hypothetical protein